MQKIELIENMMGKKCYLKTERSIKINSWSRHPQVMLPHTVILFGLQCSFFSTQETQINTIVAQQSNWPEFSDRANACHCPRHLPSVGPLSNPKCESHNHIISQETWSCKDKDRTYEPCIRDPGSIYSHL